MGEPGTLLKGVQQDSRKVSPGDAFVAVAGEHHHGDAFAPDALEKGAVAIVAEHPIDGANNMLLVSDARRVLPSMAHRLYGEPTRELAVVGVTGTNGKTTVTHLVEGMLSALGHKPALLGTVAFRGPGFTDDATHTTPEADTIARFARRSVDAGASHLVMEVSSHGLAQYRSDAVRYAVAAFTNFSRDHLDFHGTVDAYKAAKERLFLELKPARSVLVVDHPVGQELFRTLKERGEQVWSCSALQEDADFGVVSADFGRHGVRAQLNTPMGPRVLETPLLGRHNLENAIVAVGIAHALSISVDDALVALRNPAVAPGRLESIGWSGAQSGEEGLPLVLVDYAHTPDALNHSLAALNPLTPGRLWVVFGCGGDRDPGKRPLMGKGAAENATHIIVTNDNPRGEEPAQIAEAVVGGIRSTGLREAASVEALVGQPAGYCVVLDRQRAIREAIAALRPNDTLLIAGKGHETVQIVGASRIPFDDRAEAQQAMGKRAGG